MHEATRSEITLAMSCYKTFFLAMKAVSAGIDREISTAEYTKIWDVIQDVASGVQTLNASPAELHADDANMLPTMRKGIQETTQQAMRDERAIAAMLLRAAEGFVIREGTAG